MRLEEGQSVVNITKTVKEEKEEEEETVEGEQSDILEEAPVIEEIQE